MFDFVRIKAIECSKNQLKVKRMKKRVNRGKNRFDSKDDCIYTKFSYLKMSKLENFFFIKVVYHFESFHSTNSFPDFDIGPKIYGQNTETVHRGAKNPVFGAVWVETPPCNEKRISL